MAASRLSRPVSGGIGADFGGLESRSPVVAPHAVRRGSHGGKDVVLGDAVVSPSGWSSVEQAIRARVLERVHGGAAFKPVDIVDAIEGDVGSVPVDRVARVLKRLFDDGPLKRFGYRRTLGKEKTRAGIVTAVLYAPPSTARTAPPPGSSLPTRPPTARLFGYLGLRHRDARRLERQTEALRRTMSKTAEDLIRVGALLSAIRSLVGPGGLGHYVDRELSMSVDTARRLIRVAEVFGSHDERAQVIAIARPSILYKLSERSFPVELREAILRDGLVIDGHRRTLERLRRKDLDLAKRQYIQKRAAVRDLQRQIAEAERDASRAAEHAELRAHRQRLESIPMNLLLRDIDRALESGATESLANDARRFVDSLEEGGLGREQRRGLEALKKLLEEIED